MADLDVDKGTHSVASSSESTALLRDQRRALYAYDVVNHVPEEKRKDYEIAVNDLPAHILRGGLCAALAELEREKDGRGGLMLDHIARARIPGLGGATRDDVADRVRRLDVDAYMLATRETLRLAAWLKRAVQATFEDR